MSYPLACTQNLNIIAALLNIRVAGKYTIPLPQKDPEDNKPP